MDRRAFLKESAKALLVGGAVAAGYKEWRTSLVSRSVTGSYHFLLDDIWYLSEMKRDKHPTAGYIALRRAKEECARRGLPLPIKPEKQTLESRIYVVPCRDVKKQAALQETLDELVPLVNKELESLNLSGNCSGQVVGSRSDFKPDKKDTIWVFDSIGYEVEGFASFASDDGKTYAYDVSVPGSFSGITVPGSHLISKYASTETVSLVGGNAPRWRLFMALFSEATHRSLEKVAPHVANCKMWELLLDEGITHGIVQVCSKERPEQFGITHKEVQQYITEKEASFYYLGTRMPRIACSTHYEKDKKIILREIIREYIRDKSTLFKKVVQEVPEYKGLNE